jgi:hypothetical protein
MKKLVIAALAASSLALGVATAPAHAQGGLGSAGLSYPPPYDVGSIYDPYPFYLPSTGEDDFPSYQPPYGVSPADPWLSGGEWGGGVGGMSSGTIDPSGQTNGVISLDGKVLP